MVSGSCQMMSGRFHMVSGRCQMVSTRWDMVWGRSHIVPVRWQIVSGSCNMVSGRCQMFSGRYQGVSGSCPIPSGMCQIYIFFFFKFYVRKLLAWDAIRVSTDTMPKGIMSTVKKIFSFHTKNQHFDHTADILTYKSQHFNIKFSTLVTKCPYQFVTLSRCVWGRLVKLWGKSGCKGPHTLLGFAPTQFWNKQIYCVSRDKSCFTFFWSVNQKSRIILFGSQGVHRVEFSVNNWHMVRLS